MDTEPRYRICVECGVKYPDVDTANDKLPPEEDRYCICVKCMLPSAPKKDGGVS